MIRSVLIGTTTTTTTRKSRNAKFISSLSSSSLPTIMLLKDWILGLPESAAITVSSSTTTTNDNSNSNTSSTTSTNVGNILLMDGGVSTHLEQLLRQQTKNDKASFPNRSLWSSSLLLDKYSSSSSSSLINGSELILQGHKDWLYSGSNIITTVTYQCHYGTTTPTTPTTESDSTKPSSSACFVKPVVNEEQMTRMIQLGIQLAQQAISQVQQEQEQAQEQEQKKKLLQSSLPKYYVVGSSGCYGAALADGSEYTGMYGSTIDPSYIEEFHRRKVQTFFNTNSSTTTTATTATCLLDGLAIETIPCVSECRAVCKVLVEESTKRRNEEKAAVACWISLACQNGSLLNEGAPLQAALDVIREEDPTAEYVHAIGINCCDSAHISSLLEVITSDMATKGPRRGIVIYPNSGEEWNAENESWKEGTGCTDSEQFAMRLMEAVETVRNTWEKHRSGTIPPRLIIGGCCRTSPATINALRKWIDSV